MFNPNLKSIQSDRGGIRFGFIQTLRNIETIADRSVNQLLINNQYQEQ